MLEIWACGSLILLYYIYDGYGRLLRLLLLLRRSVPLAPAPPGFAPPLTVIITVHNEARQILARVADVLACRYPADHLEIVVASDGSTDGTDELVRGCGWPGVRLVRPVERGGKSATQNAAIAEAAGEILVFTDADTRFDREFLVEIAGPFADPRVGGVDGHLLFSPEPGSALAGGQSRYWRHELDLRTLESQLGWLAIASGACMAVRRQLLRPLPATVGEDCIVPLDVVDQGFQMRHALGAIALDTMTGAANAEFQARVRMTVRNWQGTWLRPSLLNPFNHPGYALALWSHKLLRWCSPLLLLSGFISTAALLPTGSPLGWVFWAFFALFVLGFVSWVTQGKSAVRVPLAATAYSFLLANAAFLVGLFFVASGRQITTYRR